MPGDGALTLGADLRPSTDSSVSVPFPRSKEEMFPANCLGPLFLQSASTPPPSQEKIALPEDEARRLRFKCLFLRCKPFCQPLSQEHVLYAKHMCCLSCTRWHPDKFLQVDPR